MRLSQISAIASDGPIYLRNISFDQKTPLYFAKVINEYLHGSNDTYTKIEGEIQVTSDSNFEIVIIGSAPNSKGSETIFSLIDEIGDVKTFHVLEKSPKINVFDFQISATSKKIQILAASKLENGKVANVCSYELLVKKAPWVTLSAP